MQAVDGVARLRGRERRGQELHVVQRLDQHAALPDHHHRPVDRIAMRADREFERSLVLARDQHAAMLDALLGGQRGEPGIELVEGGQRARFAVQAQAHQPVLGLVRDRRRHALGHHRQTQLGHGAPNLLAVAAQPMGDRRQAGRGQLRQALHFIERGD